jgi:hypothetical protein
MIGGVETGDRAIGRKHDPAVSLTQQSLNNFTGAPGGRAR